MCIMKRKVGRGGGGGGSHIIKSEKNIGGWGGIFVVLFISFFKIFFVLILSLL